MGVKEAPRVALVRAMCRTPHVQRGLMSGCSRKLLEEIDVGRRGEPPNSEVF